MPIASLLNANIYNAHQMAVIVATFEEVLNRLALAQGTDPIREELIVRKIIAAAGRGPIEQRRLVRETLSG